MEKAENRGASFGAIASLRKTNSIGETKCLACGTGSLNRIKPLFCTFPAAFAVLLFPSVHHRTDAARHLAQILLVHGRK